MDHMKTNDQSLNKEKVHIVHKIPAISFLENREKFSLFCETEPSDLVSYYTGLIVPHYSLLFPKISFFFSLLPLLPSQQAIFISLSATPPKSIHIKSSFRYLTTLDQ